MLQDLFVIQRQTACSRAKENTKFLISHLCEEISEVIIHAWFLRMIKLINMWIHPGGQPHPSSTLFSVELLNGGSAEIQHIDVPRMALSNHMSLGNKWTGVKGIWCFCCDIQSTALFQQKPCLELYKHGIKTVLSKLIFLPYNFMAKSILIDFGLSF